MVHKNLPYASLMKAFKVGDLVVISQATQFLDELSIYPLE